MIPDMSGVYRVSQLLGVVSAFIVSSARVSGLSKCGCFCQRCCFGGTFAVALLKSPQMCRNTTGWTGTAKCV